MEDVSALVARLYEGHPYPHPVADLGEAIAKGGYQAGDPALFAPMLWPEGRPTGRLSILSAGCGTQQAAWFAYTNSDCDVFGVDLSEPSLAHERHLQERHGLTNLHLFMGDLREVAAIRDEFDVVVCTGVLHHMESPDEGIAALARVMKPGGVFAGMVYAAPHRVGVYMMQDVFRRLGVAADEQGIAFVRNTLAQLPPWHFVHHYGGAASELRQDAALVDTFLHPQDRAYTVPQLLSLVDGSGLNFQGWLENSIYYPQSARWLSEEAGERICALPEREQWAVMENLKIANFAHYFFARKGPASIISFSEPHGRDLVPHRLPRVKRLTPTDYQRAGFKFSLRLDEAELFESVDGARSLQQLQGDAAPGLDARMLFERLWKQGHVMISKPQASSSTSQ
jgi:SAM-dependent methyltransferase